MARSALHPGRGRRDYMFRARTFRDYMFCCGSQQG
jgi:hypothetical protein